MRSDHDVIYEDHLGGDPRFTHTGEVYSRFIPVDEGPTGDSWPDRADTDPQDRQSSPRRWVLLGLVVLVGASLALDWWMFLVTAAGNQGDTLNLGKFVLRAIVSCAYLGISSRIFRRGLS
jgi:hypothetical protein